MDYRGKIWIIPQTEGIIKTYERDIPRGMLHTDFFQEFSNIYNLGFQYSIIDYQKAPCEMALMGNLVIKTDLDERTMICYIPNSVSENQLNFINDNLDKISDGYNYVLGYSDIVEYLYDGKHIHSIEDIKKECNKKRKTEGEKNVR